MNDAKTWRQGYYEGLIDGLRTASRLVREKRDEGYAGMQELYNDLYEDIEDCINLRDAESDQ